ncbi:MAG: FAD-dependent monooxygenase, partial [Pseudomonadota bacterium]
MNFDGIPIWREYEYSTPAELNQGVGRVETLIVGGGPIGLALALDLARKNHQVTLLNALPFVTRGSKAICFSKRTLDIWDRLGVAERLVEKGVIWEKGKVFWRDEETPIYEFDLLPVKDQKNPAFINLQQYYVEEYLVERAREFSDLIELRFKNKVVGIDQHAKGAQLQ